MCSRPKAGTSGCCRCANASRCWPGCWTSLTGQARRAPAGQWRANLGRGLRAGLGGSHRQARGRAVPCRADQGLAQVQVPQQSGIRDRRLYRPAGLARGAGRAADRLLRRPGAPDRGRQGGDGLQRRGTRRACADCSGSLRGTTRHSMPARCPGPASPDLACPDLACTGWSRGWSPRSASRNGRPAGSCGTRGSRDCARTRTRKAWYARSLANRARASIAWRPQTTRCAAQTLPCMRKVICVSATLAS